MATATKTKFPTIEDRLTGVIDAERFHITAAKRGEKPPMVLEGLRAKRPPATEGLCWLTPEQLLTLKVPEVQLNGKIKGFQRTFKLDLARRMVGRLRDGYPFPPIIVGIVGRDLILPDGQHRAAAGVIARVPIEAVFHKMTMEQASQLFTGQRYSTRVPADTIVLSDNGPFERYIKEAIENDDHPWSGLVSISPRSKTRMGPNAMFQLLVRYVANAEGQGAGAKQKAANRLAEVWDRGLADDLAPLIRCFGNKQTNPLAFKPANLQSIGATAMWVFRRHETQDEGDRERWTSHMPTFRFGDYPHIRTQTEMTDRLVAHWNKRLRGKRRVRRP